MQPSTPHDPLVQYKSPKLVSQTHYCVMGDVTVADGVAIAPGVVLQASPGSRIVIAAGACLSAGVCVQSRNGVLTIGAGVSLGANVLVVGNGTVGANSCVSPGSTLMNPQIEAGALLQPGTLVDAAANAGFGARASVGASAGAGTRASASTNVNAQSNGFTSGSYVANPASFAFMNGAQNGAQNGTRSDTQSGPPQVTTSQQNDSFVNTFVEPPPGGPKPIEIPSLSDQNGQYVDPSAQPLNQSNGVQLNNGYGNNSHTAANGSANGSALAVTGNSRVYGKDQVTQLIATLFPNRPA